MEQQYENERIKQLAKKWVDGDLSPEERKEFNTWYTSHSDELLELSSHLGPDSATIRDRMHSNIIEGIKENRTSGKKIFPLWSRWLVTAASIFVITGLIFKYRSPSERKLHITSTAFNVTPGGNKATLVLSNGKRINLNDAADGSIASESGITITKTTDGQIVYSVTDRSDLNVSTYHTIETPMGGQYKVALPDGTTVLLNAASKLIYPVDLMGRGQRIVELSGEAYFQVAKDKSHPFIVMSGGQAVEVLGTHFNINSYADEPRITTTLEEGAVKVSANNNFKILKPGQQATKLPSGVIQVAEADIAVAMAWKNNEFAFKDATVQQVMRQIARWYDLKIQYQGGIPDDTITGTIDRTSNLNTVLHMFATIQLHFKLVQDGSTKTLIVSP